MQAQSTRTHVDLWELWRAGVPSIRHEEDIMIEQGALVEQCQREHDGADDGEKIVYQLRADICDWAIEATGGYERLLEDPWCLPDSTFDDCVNDAADRWRIRRSWKLDRRASGIRFEPRDIWIGVFWDREGSRLSAYVCLLPLLPLRLTWRKVADAR